MEHKIIIPESVHAYTYLGEPVPEVPLKNPVKTGACLSCGEVIKSTNKGDRAKCPKCKVKVDISTFAVRQTTPTTTRHFRKYGLFPSASRLAQYGEMDIEFTNWYETRLANFIMEQYHPNRDIWWKRVKGGIEDLKNEFADRGSQIHGWIQQALEGEVVTGADATGLRAIEDIQGWIRAGGYYSVRPEQGYCDPVVGIGGTIDFDGECATGIDINDWKTKHSKSSFEAIKEGNRKPLWKAIKQLSTYKVIRGGVNRVFVSPIRVDEEHPDTGETLFIELTQSELDKGYRAMQAALRAWETDRDYYPREMYENGECWSLAQIVAGTKDVGTDQAA